ncbi:Crp/Fnr family transcriptional regulator [Amphritea pacifica]|uniref:Cyclic nucleotide-binding domain-containing protein n=1 Tax=Amphritea pacifica TaxID=2811233 RepID=A0ABS2WBL6_9GAMM|nr:cyclic nucleotide-binding domain-containing protein [Amphritea pacifica]MBN0989120.1 cyclic nucleotide-binding domain-containing protein [Amphritea pacifica]MBN1008604.1 cyclic nucleotide-binding domain-containing protein [Amphritea pacifica]
MKTITAEDIHTRLPQEKIRQGSLFGALTDDCINFILEQGRILELASGEKVFDAGDSGNAFYVVLEGSLSFVKLHDGKRYNTRDIGFGEEVGFVAMIALHNHAGYAVANCDSRVLEISSDLFARVHENYPFDFGIITLNLARDMARNIRKLSNALVENAIKY